MGLRTLLGIAGLAVLGMGATPAPRGTLVSQEERVAANRKVDAQLQRVLSRLLEQERREHSLALGGR